MISSQGEARTTVFRLGKINENHLAMGSETSFEIVCGSCTDVS